MLHIFLAEGFEEIEAFTTIDILRRCNLEVQLVSITGTRLIRGAHGIAVMAETVFRKGLLVESDGLIFPGGMPGASNLLKHDGLRKLLLVHKEKGTLIAAICAAPIVLGRRGLLKGIKATCYPGFESELEGAEIVSAPVVEDGNIITGQGPSAAKDFAFAIATRFASFPTIAQVKAAMLLPSN